MYIKESTILWSKYSFTMIKYGNNEHYREFTTHCDPNEVV